MKIFITGANGFIGQHLVNYLARQGYEIYAMVRFGVIPGFELSQNVNVVWGDLQDSRSLQKIVPVGATVINLAANPYDPKLSRLVNVDGTKKFVEICESKKVSKFIQISSQATKIKNKGVYSITKGESDEIVSQSKLEWVILKPSLVYGGGDKGLFNKIKGMVNMLPFIPVFGNGEILVNPVHVDDLSKYLELVVNDRAANKVVYDIGCLEGVSYNQLYTKILGYLGRKNPLLHIPVWIGLMAGNFFKLLGMKTPPFYVDNVLGSTQPTNCDASAIVKKYKLVPMNFDDGLKKVFSSDDIKIGVVGLGKMGMMHLAALSAIKGVRIAALVDSNTKSWPVIKSMGVSGNFYDNLDTALDSEKLDGVFILTPTFTHLNLLKKCLKKGLSVFVEKPLAMNSIELDKLKVLESKYSGKVFVGYTLLFKRSINEFKRIIDKKSYGKIKSFKASYEHGEVFGVKKGWMFNRSKSGGGVLMNPGPHLFSVTSFLLGVPKSISGKIDKIFSTTIDDEANLTLDYGEYVGEMFLSWSVKGVDIPKMLFEIQFEKAMVTSDGKSLTITSNGKSVTYLEKDLPAVVPGMFELNPDASGEAYSTEDYLFINSIRDVKDTKTKVVANNLKWVIGTEAMIHESYKVSQN
ncbi:Gfo/Idh/MocA family oxidoreductase [Candidatus Shapirobacteria bacterium]|nr:Gfo/Idh/MocA family oxidoreductase [Candidatus Shapirobacteria bacterium]